MLKNPKTIPIALSVIIVILAATVVALLVFMKNQPLQSRGVPNIIEIAAMEPDSALWGVNFPNQYTTFQQTGSNTGTTPYGGSDPVQKLDVDPRLRTLFAGMAFSKDYKEDRGHLWSLTDVRETERISETTPGTCYSCKSANNPMLWAEMGAAEYARTPFAELGMRIDQPVGCANCHEAGSMRLIVTNPALEEALEAQGKDWRTFTRQEMRTVVCANCHVEYYFKPARANYWSSPGPTAPRSKIENTTTRSSFRTGRTPKAGAPMIKMQHPEYELFTGRQHPLQRRGGLRRLPHALHPRRGGQVLQP
jgi:nitrite reductase (cytochrome c-552)